MVRLYRILHPSSARVVVSCRLVQERCKLIHTELKHVISELVCGFQQITSLKNPQLTPVGAEYRAAASYIERDLTVRTFLTRLAEIRKHLAAQEAAYYEKCSLRPATFSDAFLAASELRNVTALAEAKSREISDLFIKALFRITTVAIRSVFVAIDAPRTESVETIGPEMQLKSVGAIPIPSLAEVVADVEKAGISAPASFGQATRDFGPLIKGEVVQVLAEIRSDLLVRRCHADGIVELVPRALIPSYSVAAVERMHRGGDVVRRIAMSQEDDEISV